MVAGLRYGVTPVAIIEQGTTVDQRVITGTLADIGTVASLENVRPPAIIVVGEVAAYHHQLAWFQPDKEQQETTTELFQRQPTFVGD